MAAIITTLTEMGCRLGQLQDLVPSENATTASGTLFQEKVSEQEHIPGYLLMTDILDKYVCFMQYFHRISYSVMLMLSL